MSVVCARCGRRASLARPADGACCAHCGEPLDEPTIISDADEPKTERSLPAATPWASPASLVQGNLPKVTVGRPVPPPPPPPGTITATAPPLPPPPAVAGPEPARVPGVPSLPTAAPLAGAPRSPSFVSSRPQPASAVASRLGRTLIGTPAPVSPSVPAPSAIVSTMLLPPAAAPLARSDLVSGGLDPMIEAASAPLAAPWAGRADSPEPSAFGAAVTLQPEEVPQERSVPPLAQPLGFQREAPPPGRELVVGVSWKAALAVAGLVAVGVTALFLLRGRTPAARAARATVQLLLADGTTGAGFFVEGPDDGAYVATAFHVIESGAAVTVRRSVAVDASHAYVEAFPDVEVVAADPDADLAVLRLRDVPRTRVETLPLAASAQAGQPVTTYGFAGAASSGRATLVGKPGNITRLDKLPSYDRQKPGAMDAILLAPEIEPGASGGPSLDAKGEVVGIGLAKEGAYQGSPGAVNVAALRQLLGSVQSAGAARGLGAEDVQRFLARLEVEYLMQPLAERPRIRPYDYVAPLDLARVRVVAGSMRGRGASALAVFPGRLETYQDRVLQERLQQCAREGAHRLLPPSACAHLADRPLTWDFTAAAVRWEGKVRPLQVTKLEEVDARSHLYRAEVGGSGLAGPIQLFFSAEQGRPRLRLFDALGDAYWLKRAGGGIEAFTGRWVLRTKGEAGGPRAEGALSGMRRCEEVLVSRQGDVTAVTYTLEREARTAVGRRSVRGPATVRSMVQVDFKAEIAQEDALVLGARETAPRREGACEPHFCAIEPRALVLKLAGSTLFVYRDGPEGTIESSPLRKAAEGCSSGTPAREVGPKAKRGKKGGRTASPGPAASGTKRGAKVGRKRGRS